MRWRISAAFAFVAAMLWAAAASGPPRLSVQLDQDLWRVNEAGVLKFRIAVEERALRAGGRISITIPGSWVMHAFHLYEDNGKVRANQPYGVLTQELAEFISVEGPADSRWRTEIVEQSADGSYHRFSRTVVLTLEEGKAAPGEALTVSYGDAEQPIHASFLSETVRFPVRVDPGGVWKAVEPSPSVETYAGRAVELLLTASSEAAAGAPVPIHVTARDEFGNPAALPAALEVRGADEIVLRETAGRRVQRGYVKFFEEGFHVVEAGNAKYGFVRSNPIRVTAAPVEERLYWGDLHSHSSASKDGIGETPFSFARDYANLDFYALSDHSTGDRGDPGVTDKEWAANIEAVKSFHDPGRFVTLLAYECSLPYPWGHHNVYFAEDEAPIFRKHEVKTLPELWRRLEDYRSFTVPHHTGIVFGGGPGRGQGVVWDRDHPSRPLLEIYSGHGQSELFDRSHPLSYDNLIFLQRWKNWFQRQAPETPDEYRDLYGPSSAPGPHYARDAWAVGLRLGTIASSDDHTARPGQASKGLVAVRAPRLERKAVFDALTERQTYATTGERIYLDFRVNGRPPGSQISLDGPAVIEVEIAASEELEWVELMRLNRLRKKYEVAKKWTPESWRWKARFEDSAYEDAALYYVRAKRQGLVGGRPVMAWSTPVWVE